MNKKHNILYFCISTHGACDCNNSFNFQIFSNFQDEEERKLFKLHFYSLSQIQKMVIGAIARNTSHFWLKMA